MAAPLSRCQRREGLANWLSQRRCFSFPPMAISAGEIEALAALLSRALLEGASAPIKGPQNAVTAAIIAALLENFRMEAAIDREADKQIQQLGASARGLDPDKLRSGLRERIAKQRGFAL
jgi:hypothetical protein